MPVSSPTRLTRGRVLGDLSLFVGYALLALWWLWPAPLVWTTHVAYHTTGGTFGASGTADFYLIVWVLSWVAHAICRAPWQLFHANTFHPAPYTLAYSEHLIGYLPLFGPTYWMSGNALLALNLTAFLTYPLSAYFTYLLARRHIGAPAAVVCGAFFAFSAARYLLPPHFHLLGIQYLPLILYAVDKWLAYARRRDAALLALALLLQSLSSAYLMYAAFFLCLTAFPLATFEHRRQLDRRRIGGLVAIAVIVGGVLLVVMAPYWTLRQYGLVPAYDPEHPPPGLVPALTWKQLAHYLREEGVGWLGYALALVGALPGRTRSDRPLRRTGVAIVAVGLLVSLGPGIAKGTWILWSPYAFLMDVLPGLSSVRAPIRFSVIAHLGFSLLAGLGLARLTRGRRPLLGWSLAAACTALVLATRLSLPDLPLHHEPTRDTAPAVYRWLASHGKGRPVLELPSLRDADSARRAYLSTFHWSPIFDGCGAYTPKHRRSITRIASKLPDEKALQQLVNWVDVGWIVVHLDALSPAAAARWAAPLPPGLKLAARWPDAVLYRVQRRPQKNNRHLLLSTERTLQGNPIAPIGASCEGKLHFLGWRPGTIRAGEKVIAQVRIVNGSSRVWPATGFYPRGLVYAEWRIRTASGAPLGTSHRILLSQDPRPREPVSLAIWLTAPARTGSYLLELELVQDGVKPLRDCGVKPLRIPFEVADPTPRAARRSTSTP